MDTKYSLTTLLNDMLRLQNNSYQIVSSLSDLVSSKGETVEIPVLQTDGTIKSIIVPSFGALKSQIARLENDIKSLSGAGDANSSVRLSDGSFRKILVSNLQKEAEDIKSMPIPSSFATKENWFFESFLNPLLYVSFNLSNQLKFNTEDVEVSRYILNIDTDAKKKVFNESFLSKSDISFQSFVKIMLDNDIKYFLDKSVVPLPPRTVRYSGKFTVTRIVDDSIIDPNTNTQKRVLKVQLDKLTYNDNQSEFIGTQSLKIGDSLVVNSGLKNTRYEIVSVDAATRTVFVRLVEGFDSITIGSDVLSYFSVDSAPVNVDVNIGFNEYSVIFIKPIDPESKIASVNWSPGVGLYTNDLTIMDASGQEVKLSKYYQDQVVDFGAHIYSLSKEGAIPSSLGVNPDAPTLTASDFKVVQINKHATERTAITDLRRLHSDKLRIQSDMQTADAAIKDLRLKLQRTRYSTAQLEDADKNQLNTLIEQKNSLSTLFNSVLDDINSISTSFSVDDITPKYRVRGFFPMPEPKSTERTGKQEVVQFVVEYRYLSKDGNSNQPESIEFTDNTGSVRRGTFSTWIQVKSPVRTRIEDPITGNITWKVESVENGDEVNINSLDLPISEGEIIEVRIKSLSEAGWPVSPKESDWSTSMQVIFPDELESQTKTTQIVNEAREQKVRVQLQAEIDQLGLTKHVSNSLEQNGKYYAHPATEVASGFLTAERNIISLFDKLTAMDTELARLRGLLESTRGSLLVKVVDESGQEYVVNNNSTLKLFAGNYRDQVQSLQVKKGVIITKNYFVKIINNAASTLELYARFFGSRRTKAQSSFTLGTGFNAADTDYNTLRRYDAVPLGLSNPDASDVSSYGFVRNFPDQSSQVLGQFIQSRYRSVDGKDKLYIETSSTTGTPWSIYSQYFDGSPGSYGSASVTEDLEWNLDVANQTSIAGLSPAGSVSAGDFIWKGTYSAGTPQVIPLSTISNQDWYNKNICVHVKHPELADWATSGLTISQVSELVRNSIVGNQPVGDTNNLSKLQNVLFYEGAGNPTDKYCKVGFEPNDQYLLGPRSVGAYLFMNPTSHANLVVDGSDSLSVKSVEFGDSSSINIPITFQYRMTDYFGDGDNGNGNLAGKLVFGKNENLTYTKTIGIDIYSNLLNKERFSFDIEVTARYYSKTIVEKDIPTRTFPATMDDLAGIVKTLQPELTRDVNPFTNDIRNYRNYKNTNNSE
jgi:hypothetical protein